MTAPGGGVLDEVGDRAVRVLAACRRRGLTVVTAESCTGGLVAGALTDLPGSSAVFERGFVTYSNAAKAAVLGVPEEVLARHGAVSRHTAQAMAQGALDASPADLAVAVTGIAGPGGGTVDKPVGLVHFAAAARSGRRVASERRFGGAGRAMIRLSAVAEALALLEALAIEAREDGTQEDGVADGNGG